MDDETIAAATALAREALALLDSIGAARPASYLQHAIDVMTDAPVPQRVEDVEAAFSKPEGQALLRHCGLQ